MQIPENTPPEMAPPAAAPEESLRVIALVSGGKDSFFSVLHCLANGHRVVALANLHPPPGPLPGPGPSLSSSDVAAAATTSDDDHHQDRAADGQSGQEETEDRDLNSFMYQTVGHQAIPLYADATGIPLYRRAIVGGAAQTSTDYSHFAAASAPVGKAVVARGNAAQDARADETESMVPLLRAVMAAHPDANAVCAGAILSTYQRTRVESVATRLGLVPLAFLWKFPILPTPGPSGDDGAQLLADMAVAGMEARIIKVASGGLDESALWTNVASIAGRDRIQRSMRRFGVADRGAVLGEGGEFETLVLDGPAELFRKRIVVDGADRRVVREGGGSAWLMLRNARTESKDVQAQAEGKVRIPDLLDARFVSVLETLQGSLSTTAAQNEEVEAEAEAEAPHLGRLQVQNKNRLLHWCVIGDVSSRESSSIETETRSLVERIRALLSRAGLPPSAIINSTIVLRRMSDFPTINAIYGALFDAPVPPARVTVACGQLLPSLRSGVNIAVYLTVHPALKDGQRQGLHVQSRSYWAPANIGPYSQAVTVPAASLASSARVDTDGMMDGVRLVSIAGQIPLVPATMVLPGGGDDSLRLQLSLSLQHLWRIGVEVGVQWWTSAVAYFPHSPTPNSGVEMSRKAGLAAQAWETAHLFASQEQDSDGDEGPDLWDKKFNPRYMSLSATDPRTSVAELPDREVLTTPNRVVPPVFAVEVAELPRAAGVEWHAHMGISRAGAGSVTVRRRQVPLTIPSSDKSTPEGVAHVHQVIIHHKERKVYVVQTIVAEKLPQPLAREQELSLQRHTAYSGHDQIALEAVSQLGDVNDNQPPSETVSAVVRYVDVKFYPNPLARIVQSGDKEGAEGVGGGEKEKVAPCVPCASVWDAQGQRLSSVTVYQSVFERA
ncbi:hypothetical protein QBC46DRAFT_461712 [Diplogelasinospora grovesii]|uniref:Diphthine--ammonia ligase n=1 Tax=Diplogelasinospora grovesii TaxID=303347 RepID=A0AAN6N1F4_9PEZI|nr:hypothetical protein QBC46DRAFT_461712 [Diplogelasinospora grovesii]